MVFVSVYGRVCVCVCVWGGGGERVRKRDGEGGAGVHRVLMHTPDTD